MYSRSLDVSMIINTHPHPDLETATSPGRDQMIESSVSRQPRASESSLVSRSEPEPCGELRLERVEDIPGRAETERVRGRRVRIIDAAPHGVDVLHIGPVEHVEEIEQQLQPRARVHREVTTDAQIDRRIARSFVDVPSNESWSIRVRIAVAVGVAADEDVERPAAFERHQTADSHASGELTERTECEPLPNVLAGSRHFSVDVQTFGDVCEVGERVDVRMHVGKCVTAVNAETPVEPPLDFQRHAVV